LRGEFQLLPEPIGITAPGKVYSELEEDTISELIDDARWIFSGMIYGYVVTWVPPFNARRIKEKLDVKLVAQIPAGDEKLKTLSANKLDGVIYVLMEYTSDSAQQKRLEAWRSSLFPSAAGEGNSPIAGGSRRKGLEMAIKEAIKNHLVKREFNRPKRVQARVVLTEFPQIGLSKGAYRVLVSIRMDINSVQNYEID